MQLRRKHFKYPPERLRVAFPCDANKSPNLLFGDFGFAFQLFHEQVHFSSDREPTVPCRHFSHPAKKVCPSFPEKSLLHQSRGISPSISVETRGPGLPTSLGQIQTARQSAGPGSLPAPPARRACKPLRRAASPASLRPRTLCDAH